VLVYTAAGTIPLAFNRRVGVDPPPPPPSESTVEGTVEYRGGLAIDGIAVSLVGTTGGGGSVSRSTTSGANGTYQFTELEPGSYTVSAAGEPFRENGGSLSAGTCPGTTTDAACEVDVETTLVTVDFVYTPCTASDRHPNGEPPTNCPIVFVPGFLGSRMACLGPTTLEELWPNIPNARFGEMTLAEDGYTNEGEPGSCSHGVFAVPGREGLVATAATKDVYQGAIDFLDRIAAGRWWAYTYDWRRAVPEAIGELDATIDEVLEETGASRVVLMAHSMGGLVSRLFIDDTDRAGRVSRVVTLGTPYWGAPKTHFALLEGDTDTPGSAVFDLDLFVNAADLQRFAGHCFGAFWLYPSANFGPWLSLSGVPQDAAGVDQWVVSLGAAPALLDEARAGHAQLDGFRTNGVDYAVVVGAGLATVTHINLREDLVVSDEAVSVGQWADLTYGSGDSTVPAVSATQGGFGGGAPLGAPVSMHYACGVGHVDLPGTASVDERISGFLIEGAPVGEGGADCDEATDYAGTEIRAFQLDILQKGARCWWARRLRPSLRPAPPPRPCPCVRRRVAGSSTSSPSAIGSRSCSTRAIRSPSSSAAIIGPCTCAPSRARATAIFAASARATARSPSATTAA
jgi:pimeloyl-ACP methyl ester carboxylesterase